MIKKINHRRPSIDIETVRFPETGNVRFAAIVDNREMCLSAHTTWEVDQKGKLQISCYAENGKAAPGVYLTPEAATALRDALDAYLAYHAILPIASVPDA